MHNERRDWNMKTIHLTDEETDAIDCALGIVLGMAEGAKIVSLRAAMESARKEVARKEIWWCNTHQRKADSIYERGVFKGEHRCSPKLGGIMIPCECVELTGIAEIVDE